MIPIVTPAEMAEVDAAASEPVKQLIARAGSAVAWAARQHLGGTYGRRVVVLAGPGNNGADGLVAGSKLAGWGAAVDVRDPFATAEVPPCDLVVDAALGTGISRPFAPPSVSAPVLAVDIPSGVDGQTGEVSGGALAADLTVTFQALKPGLLLSPGQSCTGSIIVADLGLDVSGSRCHLVTEPDVRSWLPQRATDAHKWHSACWVVAGSETMKGAALLAARAAGRSGAGYVRLSSPGTELAPPLEVVGRSLPASGWGRDLEGDDRFASFVLGPGLGRSPDTRQGVLMAVGSLSAPVVLDADALWAVAESADAVSARPGHTVLTPHDGEYELLMGHRPGPDRIEAVRDVARRFGSTVLLKGPTTAISDAHGNALVVNTGDSRLATAGTGDVLAGVIGALLAQGMAPSEAAAAGAWLHGSAAKRSSSHAMVASDLLGKLGEVIDATHLG